MPLKPEIGIEDFDKIDLRVVRVISAEIFKGTDKLLKLQVDLGNEKRQILSGLQQHIKPENLVDKKVIIVANLASRKMKGELSQGMILAVENSDGKLVPVFTDASLPEGSVAK